MLIPDWGSAANIMTKARLSRKHSIITMIMLACASSHSCVQAAPEANPKAGEAALLFKRAKQFRNTGFIDKAYAVMKQCLLIAPKNPEYLTFEAEVLLADEEPEQALVEVNKALAGNPKRSSSLETKASILIFLGRNSDALDAATAAVKAMPNASIGWRVRAEAYKKLKKPDLEIADLTKAIEIAPHDWPGYADRADANLRLRNFNAVIADETFVIENIRSRLEVRKYLTRRAEAYIGLKKYNEAKADLIKAIAAWPDDYQIHKRLYDLCITTGDKQGALKEERAMKEIRNSL